LPTAVGGTAVAVNNPGGSVSVPVGSELFSGTDPDGGSIDSLLMVSFPLNATTISVNGNTYTNATFPVGGVVVPTDANGNPKQPIEVNPEGGGNVTVKIPFLVYDNAGFPSLLKDTVNVVFTSTVPVKIISFTALPSGNSAVLNWLVNTDIELSAYEIEWSKDGNRFEKIGAVNAGNRGNYSYVHSNPSNGVNYYRLKLIGKNGEVTYSQLRVVNYITEPVFVVYPNPATQYLKITTPYNMLQKASVVSILSVDGKLLYQRRIVSLQQTETIDVSKLSSGSYFLQIKSGTQMITKQFDVLR
jgi:hypothetical protein